MANEKQIPEVLVRLSDDALDQHEKISDDTIVEALNRGREERAAAEAQVQRVVPNSRVRFK